MAHIKYIAIAVAILAANAFSQEIVFANGTATNPIIKADAPDVSIIRVGNAYYMVSTTMYFAPYAPVMKSYDLVNWRIVSYCTDVLESTASGRPSFDLAENSNNDQLGEYARRQWAASLRYYQNKFWVMFANNTTGKTYLFHTENADTGPWTRIEFNRQFHDPSLFYDEPNNKLYVVSGNGSISITELELDGSKVKQGGVSKEILKEANLGLGGTVSGTEGSQLTYRNGYYYVIMITWLNSMRTVVGARTQDLVNGPYTFKQLLRSGIGSRGGGVAQGSIVQTPDGDWYGLFFQDRDAIGRVPALVPMTWGSDNWPSFTSPVPETFNIKLAQNYGHYVYASDEFSDSKLALVWQWNHNPDNSKWSLSEKPGYLRLKTVGTAKTMFHARNTLTQRTIEPESEATVLLEPSNMKDGDKAGLMVLSSRAGFVGIEQEAGKKYIVMYTGDNETEGKRGKNATENREERVEFSGDKIYLRVLCRFRSSSLNADRATFSYSLNGTTWTSIGTTVNLVFNYQTHFTGARFGLINYAKGTTGGHVDFDYYRLGGNLSPSSSSATPSSSSAGPPVACNYQTSFCGGMAFENVLHNTNSIPSTGECVYIGNFVQIQPSLESTVSINGLARTCGTEWGEDDETKCPFNIKPAAIDGGYYVFVQTGTVNSYENNGWQGVVAKAKPNCTSFTAPSSSSRANSSSSGGVTPILSHENVHINAHSKVEIYDLKGNKVSGSLPSGVYLKKMPGKRIVKFVVR